MLILLRKFTSPSIKPEEKNKNTYLSVDLGSKQVIPFKKEILDISSIDMRRPTPEQIPGKDDGAQAIRFITL